MMEERDAPSNFSQDPVANKENHSHSPVKRLYSNLEMSPQSIAHRKTAAATADDSDDSGDDHASIAPVSSSSASEVSNAGSPPVGSPLASSVISETHQSSIYPLHSSAQSINAQEDDDSLPPYGDKENIQPTAFVNNELRYLVPSKWFGQYLSNAETPLPDGLLDLGLEEKVAADDSKISRVCANKNFVAITETFWSYLKAKFNCDVEYPVYVQIDESQKISEQTVKTPQTDSEQMPVDTIQQEVNAIDSWLLPENVALRFPKSVSFVILGNSPFVEGENTMFIPPECDYETLRQLVESKLNVVRGAFRIYSVTSPIRPSILHRPRARITVGEFRELSLKLLDKINYQLDGDAMLIEVMGRDFTWPSDAPVMVQGTEGLQNLGNSCYMNSALQCLLHIEELVAYFLSNKYKSEINTDNPIGYGGDIARAYANLVHKMYPPPSQQAPSFSPREFKYTIARHSQAFAGYGQQDSQEFVAFLLDGLHEDLNRILKKPATEKPELPDDKVTDIDAINDLGRECWRLHKSRNDSVIQDLFTGMYKSTLHCPECGKVSITFDPFSDLTLPLSSKSTWTRKFKVLPLNAPLQVVEVEMDSSSTVLQVKENIGKIMGLKSDNLHMAEIFKAKFYKHFQNYPIFSSEVDPGDDIVIYELPLSVTSASTFLVPVMNRKTDSSHGYSRYVSSEFGIPYILAFDRNDTDISLDSLISYMKKTLDTLTQPTEGTVQAIENVTGVDILIAPSSDGYEIFEDAKYSSTMVPIQSRVELIARANGVVTNPDNQLPDSPTSDVITAENENGTPASTDKDAHLTSNHSEVSPIASPVVQGATTPLDEWQEVSLPGQETEDAKMNNASPTMSSERSSSPAPSLCPAFSLEESQHNLDDKDETINNLILPGEGIYCEWQEEHYKFVFAHPYWTSPGEFVNKELLESRRKGPKKNVNMTIDDCLDLFAKPEILGEHDLWYCSNCKELRQATKTISLWKVPDVLSIHLKRFSSSRSLRDKIDDVVDFPITGLDLSKRVCGSDSGENLIYDLVAIDNHYGGLSGGHYTAYAKNPVDDKWYYFDDSRVSESSVPEPKGSAYLLFYRRRQQGHLGEVSYGSISDVITEAANNADTDALTESNDKAIGGKILNSSFQGEGRRIGSSGYMKSSGSIFSNSMNFTRTSAASASEEDSANTDDSSSRDDESIDLSGNFAESNSLSVPAVPTQLDNGKQNDVDQHYEDEMSVSDIADSL